MKKIIILIALLTCFGWSNCRLTDRYHYNSQNYIEHFDFICNIDYINYKNRNDSIKYSITIKDSEIISIWQIIYSGENRYITTLLNNSITTITKDIFDVEMERYSHTYDTEDYCKKLRISVWNKLKKYIPVKDGKIFFPINNY